MIGGHIIRAAFIGPALSGLDAAASRVAEIAPPSTGRPFIVEGAAP